ncbi:hypothetical protein QBC32DRAFT_225417 [Pseudoneurospora amorphoporcata]|uniref:Uncharacterized protein n=1 Tax=Pseudoneurospora amorphoporcata TaxID=241081 RepID=A0AAN6NJ97_9PEZI|nr:hypothetical protein QBC32DRAFT_225417 [Pseudoneurospora amorphoporcata]
MTNSAKQKEKPIAANHVQASFPEIVAHASDRLFQLRRRQDEERLARVRGTAGIAPHGEQIQVLQDITNAKPMTENTTTLAGSAVGIEHLGNGQGKKHRVCAFPLNETDRITIRLPDPHVWDAMIFIPVEDIVETMITENDGMIPTKEDIETEATYFFVDVCQEYPASLIRFSVKVLIGHFEPLLERTTPTNKVYERLRANTQFVNAMRSLRAGMIPMCTIPINAREIDSQE